MSLHNDSSPAATITSARANFAYLLPICLVATLGGLLFGYGTGEEIWQQSRGEVDALVHFAGTGGAFAGIARCLLRHQPQLRTYLAEPAEARALAGEPVMRTNHPIQGGGYSMPELRLLDRSLVTGFLGVSDAEAIDGARLLAREEGIFAGFSSGANLSAALQLLAGPEAGRTIVFLACDTGMKYLSTNLHA